jgi:hypothetical protein
MDFIALSIAKKYVDDTANGLGAVKGATATIKSITPVDGGNNVVFEWTGTDGTKQTQSMFVKHGENGADGVSPTISVEKVSGGNRVTITDKNGTKSFTVKDGTGGGSGGGGVSSWNDLTDKPFDENNVIKPEALPEGYPYKKGVSIEWDGNIEGKVCVADQWYRVSDEVISNENLKIGTITTSNGVIIAANTNWDNYVSAGNITEDFAMVADGTVVVVRTPNASYMEATFEKTGVYFMRMSDVFYITKLSAETIHPMAPEFLPEPKTEEWTFTLEDDSTVTKKVVVAE